MDASRRRLGRVATKYGRKVTHGRVRAWVVPGGARPGGQGMSVGRAPDPIARRRRADDLLRQGRDDDAIRAYHLLLAVAPGHAEAWYNLGYALARVGRSEEALDAYDRALRAGIGYPQEVHLNRAVLFTDHLRRDDCAQEALQSALAVDPGYVPAHLNLGNLHEEHGERDRAVACYERVLELSAGTPSDHGQEALARMAHLRPPQGPHDPLLRRLRDEAGRATSAPVRANLWFALGRACDRLGLHEQAFEAFEAGNLINRGAGPGYDRAGQQRFVDALREAFDAPCAIQVCADSRPIAASPAPLFICGMYRSGSTLLEQVLAAHPAVFPGGELDLLTRLAAGPLAPFPASMRSMRHEQSSMFAEDYLKRLAKLFPQASSHKYITDKRPDNFTLIGLIKQIFPYAKILHSVRNPMDNGLSVFMQHLDPRAAPYASSLPDIAHYFVQYRKLMAHWKALYPGDIHDFDYDAFVQQPRPVLERALSFLGLPWDDRCLEFHRSGNSVKTASYWQVRQPLYRDACGRWRHYADYLAPLRDAWEREGIDAAMETQGGV